ncbi:MAG: UDP-N-acetylglucosamine 2-epimerase (non-hydrolyzing) [Methanomicrobiales archaeon HGW-Methanomicrobiales-3]|jgi:UDP-N-acetylglucosamine 2-epimerase (non-hydrolysing)|nr:MAG: UDP-N-acetylglucosamine 2-epimerase (non-hydrolyzing) [Methanomicrobiales archaeon HGW-Methanomicrobiales-3]
MKVMTILGTRPEIIRLSRIIEKLDNHCTHILVHTGQNFDKNLNDIFFSDLKIRSPDYFLNVKGNSAGEQIGRILAATEDVMQKEKPDRILILGDTNSSLSAIIAKRMGIPVYHMEAGNRCYDDRVPEEVNRRIIDHSSDILLPYTENSRANLIHEGISGNRILVTGNPIREVIEHYDKQIRNSDILNRLKIHKGKYFLVTLHRAENVDIEIRLKTFFRAFSSLSSQYGVPVICSIHPRTRDKLDSFEVTPDPEKVMVYEPFGFFDFIRLERDALCVLSDSGTVQEECCIFHVPNVTIRDVTERPETLECGSNILSGADNNSILNCVHIALSKAPSWNPPDEYLRNDVSETVIRIVIGYSMKSSYPV